MFSSPISHGAPRRRQGRARQSLHSWLATGSVGRSRGGVRGQHPRLHTTRQRGQRLPKTTQIARSNTCQVHLKRTVGLQGAATARALLVLRQRLVPESELAALALVVATACPLQFAWQGGSNLTLWTLPRRQRDPCVAARGTPHDATRSGCLPNVGYWPRLVTIAVLDWVACSASSERGGACEQPASPPP